MIEVQNITKSYGANPAVKNVSFEVDTGEVVGLLGPNGAGKTTTLNIITGVLYADQGEVVIDEQNLHVAPAAIKRNIGYLAEDNPLYRNLLVSEFLRLAANLKEIDQFKFQEEMEKIVEDTGIKEIYYQPISALSKGFRQRVGLAQALLGDPKILILDEPTEGLDPNQRQEIRRLITKLGKDYTVLLSTHVMQEVEAVCERVIILNKGEVVASELVSEITQTQEGFIEVDITIVGDKSGVIDQIQNDFEIARQEAGAITVLVETERQDQFYRLVSKLVNEQAYLTNLSPKKANLEEIFSRLTKET